MAVVADLSPNGKKIDVSFGRYVFGNVQKIKTVPGADWRSKDGVWRVPLDLTTGRQLRSLFGDDLKLGRELMAWARAERRRERELGAMALAMDVAPEDLNITRTHPSLYDYLRPYQRAGVSFLSTGNKINGDDMRLGKTVETLAAVIESGLDMGGWNLVVAPKNSLYSVWHYEIGRWLPLAHVQIIDGETAPDERQRKTSWGASTFVVMTAAMFRQLDWVEEVDWNSFIIDEFQISGLTNANTRHDKGSQFFQKAIEITCERKYGMSGTPIGGQPLRLWGALHFLYPKDFTSKWRWVRQWLEVSNNGFGNVIGGLRQDRKEEFYRVHSRYMLRRLKEDVVPELPEKQYEEVICDMLPKQRRQYREFQREAELILSDEHVIATNRLSEMARLKAFATAECTATRTARGRIKLHPDFAAGGKAQPLLDRLLEAGVHEGQHAAIVATQFRSVADSVFGFLSERDFRCVLVTGGVTGKRRTEEVKNFQSGDAQVIVMTARSGGIAINLDRADQVHVLDEDWDPDVQTQLEDRAVSVSKLKQVQVYLYRTRGTIEEEINNTVFDKTLSNDELLDEIRRNLLKESR